MTDLPADRFAGMRVWRRAVQSARIQTRFPLCGAILLALAGAAALTFARAQSVWTTGIFFDSDDAMRAVEVRDFLAGQGWFDVTATRVDPPHGLVMHWSRLVDAPLAGLELVFRLFLSPDMAERATRMVFPLGLLAALLALSAWTASILSEKATRRLAVLTVFLSGPMLLQFAPGRIDHHAPQIVLLMACFALFSLGLAGGRAFAMAGCAAAMALSLAISLENLPFLLVLAAALPLLLVRDGGAARAPLGWFALGALIAFPALYAATVAPDHYSVSACDAYSAVHLAATGVGALALALLAAAAGVLASARARLFAVAGAGLAVVACVLLIAPRCLGDPLGGLDPLLRDLWLSQVREVMPLAALSRETALVVALPVAFGLVAALGLAAFARDARRRGWLVAAALIAVGLALGARHVRVLSSVTPLAMIPIACAASALSARYAAGLPAAARGGLAGLLCLMATPLGLALALPAPEGGAEGAELSCLKPEILAPLAGLAPARIVAPMDMGAHLLAHTPHSVFAAPYHRDNHGGRIAVDAFLAPPHEAEKLLRAAGTELVLWCAGAKKPNILAQRAPQGLAAMLAKGEAPDWLAAKDIGAGPLRAFALR